MKDYYCIGHESFKMVKEAWRRLDKMNYDELHALASYYLRRDNNPVLGRICVRLATRKSRYDRLVEN